MSDATSTLSIVVDRTKLTGSLSRRVAVRDTIPLSITCSQGTFPEGVTYTAGLVIGETVTTATMTNASGTLTGTLATNYESLTDLFAGARRDSNGGYDPVRAEIVLTDSTPRLWMRQAVLLYYAPDLTGVPADVQSTVYLTQAAADALYESADAAIQSHITGTGSPHTAAGVGADPAGTASSAVSAHAGLTTGAHVDGAVGTPTRVDVSADIAAGQIALTVSAARRTQYAESVPAALEVTGITGTIGADLYELWLEAADAGGIALTWPAGTTTQGDAPDAAGWWRVSIEANPDGTTLVTYWEQWA
jgi:hypothetical protein